MPNVTVYSTPSCPYCHMAREYLRANKVEFSDIDVSLDNRALDEMVAKSGQIGVPVLDINGQVIVGFDKPRIAQALGLKN
ncbi:glutathione S-transferase N-terminal domain-containing protein [Candidatus Parcubacteria bacterium]|nr:glutathione S-transferase N-terminal domain-containing protein [Candidatus Parcubacteria bacterium]MBI4099199.1 glutathione S-transferase N-terminal domain-containing protein [Candidatus Parcubacteria bacterium]MBI4385405.1 glutathione S-transferase N-terminal domain-containing protein [Candidatus Parcubacteria bacterium]